LWSSGRYIIIRERNSSFRMVYTVQSHIFLTIFGVVLLLVLLLTIKSEMTFLVQNKKLKLQLVLSIISMSVLFLVTMTTLLHWFVSPIFTYTVLLGLLPILLILAPVILWLRARAFSGLARERLDEQRRLVREVMEIVDEKKREKIKEAKQSRGEEGNG
jgi:hypothetical protein